MFSGRDFYAGRTISIIVLVLGSGNNSAQVNLQTLQRALLPQQSGTTPLYFYLPGTPGNITQVINARVRAFQTSIDPNYTYGYIVARVEFFCPNPTYFNSNAQTAILGYFPPTGRVYDPATLVKTTTVTNNGWATTYPLITLNGPIDNPILGNETTNEYLNFTVSMSSSDVLVVDLYNKLITLNGVSARNLLTSGVWFAAPPGNSVFTLEGDPGSTVINETVATIEFQSAYI
jgi:phage-related protein